MNKQIAAQPGERACAGGLAVRPGCNLLRGVQVVDDLTSIELLCQEGSLLAVPLHPAVEMLGGREFVALAQVAAAVGEHEVVAEISRVS